jgi:hypothetical protein
LRRGASIPRPLRGPGPPGTGSTLEAAAPLRLVGFVDLGGRVCAKFRSDLSGSLLFTPPGAESGSEPARSTIRGTGWLYFDVDTGVLLGSIHGFRYALPLPGTAAPGPAPDFRVLLREGPCRLE